MIQKETRMPLLMVPNPQKALVVAALVAASIQFNLGADAAEQNEPVDGHHRALNEMFRTDFDADPIIVGGIPQMPFDRERWKGDSGSRIRLMNGVLRSKALLGWTKTEMDQNFGPKAATEHDGYTTYDIARNTRTGGGFGLEAVYKDGVVSSYRLVEFQPHLDLVRQVSAWVK
jgi:hypothetical protein